jgi:hypothetical protein
MVTKVFEFMDTKTLSTAVPAVCQRWRRLVRDTQNVVLDFGFLPLGRAKLLNHRADAATLETVLASLTALAGRFEHVVGCRLDTMNPSCAIALVARCPQLTRVQSSEACDQLVLTLVEHCQRLENVDWSFNDKLTDALVVKLAEHFPRLTCVNFSGCMKLTDASVVALAKLRGSQMKRVNLKLCHELTDASVNALVVYCLKLTHVYFMSCNRLTDASVMNLAKHCSLLTVVNFSYCGLLTDASVVALAEHCRKLTGFDFSGCVLLTDASVVALAEYCTLLMNAYFGGCNQLTMTYWGPGLWRSL